MPSTTPDLMTVTPDGLSGAICALAISAEEGATVPTGASPATAVSELLRDDGQAFSNDTPGSASRAGVGTDVPPSGASSSGLSRRLVENSRFRRAGRSGAGAGTSTGGTTSGAAAAGGRVRALSRDATS